jgi:hypothetical protein
VAQANYSPRWLGTVRDWCREEPLLQADSVVQTYLCALALLESPSIDTYQALLARLDAASMALGQNETAELYQHALNYCIRCINIGQEGSYQQALSLYQLLLKKKIVAHDGHLSQWTYKNITTTALRSGAFEWTEEFLYRYREMLKPSERENAFTFNMAVLYYEKQDYASALQTLQNVEFTDFTYHLAAKTVQIKCFYALSEYEPLLSLISSTQQLLRRNRTLSEFGKNANFAFLRFTKLLTNQKQMSLARKPKEGDVATLRRQIAQYAPLANKDWLLKMLE